MVLYLVAMGFFALSYRDDKFALGLLGFINLALFLFAVLYEPAIPHP